MIASMLGSARSASSNLNGLAELLRREYGMPADHFDFGCDVDRYGLDRSLEGHRERTGVCYYCRRRVPKGTLGMDHVVPLGRGGRSIRGNVVPACKDCNSRKQSLLPVEWQDYLTRLSQPADD